MKEINSNLQVYASKSDARNNQKGEPCEVSHCLIYVIHKLFNRAGSKFLKTKERDMPGVSNITALLKGLPTITNSNIEPVRGTWKKNPNLESTITAARLTLGKARYVSKEELETNIVLLERKLGPSKKPRLDECISTLSSVIVLLEIATARGWEINTGLLKHREILEFKMLEHWNRISFKVRLHTIHMHR